MNTKYNYNFSKQALEANINRLTNQLWKLIPMRENSEKWDNHLAYLIVEISGFGEIFLNDPAFISLLSKLEGLLKQPTEFLIYRKIVFEAISQLRGMLQ